MTNQDLGKTAIKNQQLQFQEDMKEGTFYIQQQKDEGGLDGYPVELQQDNDFLKLLSAQEKHLQGHDLRYYEQQLKEPFLYDYSPQEKEEYNNLPQEQKETIYQKYLADKKLNEEMVRILPLMHNFYDEKIETYIQDFKEKNPAFKDINIPFVHIPSPDAIQIRQNGDKRFMDILADHTTGATRFMLLHDQQDKATPFKIAINPIDMGKDPTIIHLNCQTHDAAMTKFSQASGMPQIIKPTQAPPKKQSVLEKIKLAASKITYNSAPKSEPAKNKNDITL